MRKLISTGPVPNTDTKIKILEEAKTLIEVNGIEDCVLEMSKPTPVGGASWTVTSKTELDKNYIGYRGFMTYGVVCERLERLKGGKSTDHY
jgi:hypothetical protein